MIQGERVIVDARSEAFGNKEESFRIAFGARKPGKGSYPYIFYV